MADLKQCDTCGKISPDENGLHIANHWPDFKLKHGTRDSPPLFSGSRTWTQVIGGFLTRHHEEATICCECYGLVRESFRKMLVERAKREGGGDE